jgi:hypothetical protein
MTAPMPLLLLPPLLLLLLLLLPPRVVVVRMPARVAGRGGARGTPPPARGRGLSNVLGHIYIYIHTDHP